MNTHPALLAEELVKTLGDADSNTAHIALKIAMLLLTHRDYSQIEFDREITNAPSYGQSGIDEN